MNSAGSSPYSCSVALTTPATPPGAPTNLAAAHHPPTSTCITVKWSKPVVNGGQAITAYRIEWSEVAAPTPAAVTRGGGGNSSTSNANAAATTTIAELLVDSTADGRLRRRARLENLRPDTAYNIRVQAINAKGRGPLSAPLKLATKPLPPGPPRLECLNVSHNTLKLKWGAAGIVRIF